MQFWKKFKRHKLGNFGFIMLLIIILVCIFANFIVSYSPVKGNYGEMYNAPNSKHLLGTDGMGRDVLTRILFGGRYTLVTVLAITIISIIIGTFFGILSGVFGSWYDIIMQRIVEIILSVPIIIGAMVIISIFGQGFWPLVLGLTIFGWPNVARMVRGEILSIREEDYIESTRALGASKSRLIFRHYLPNVVPIIIVTGTIMMANNILRIALLSFLGLGFVPPTPTWGVMLSDAQSLHVLTSKPWMWLPPGIIISITVLSINFVGDALRDALDPKHYQEMK